VIFDPDFSLITGLGLWCLMPLSTIFQSYRGSINNRWLNPESVPFPISNIEGYCDIQNYTVKILKVWTTTTPDWTKNLPS